MAKNNNNKNSVRFAVILGAFFLAFIALSNSGKRFSVDIRVLDAQSDQRLLIEAANAIDQQSIAAARAEAARLEQERAQARADAEEEAEAQASVARAAQAEAARAGAAQQQPQREEVPPPSQEVEEVEEPQAAPAPPPKAPPVIRKGESGYLLPGPGDEVTLPEGDWMLSCQYELPNAPSSRPGRPCIPPAKIYPYKENTEWKVIHGERILRAVTPYPFITETLCEGWDMFGDQTWCRKAFMQQNVSGFSFGIEERDLYSEYLSNNYAIPMRLFDCFQGPESSPPVAGRAPNATGSCKNKGGACYEAPYWPSRVCLGARKETIEGRKFDTLHGHLAGFGPLSTHVKIDVEGSEWTVLENLISSDEDQAKIRTLDMELHFGFHASSEKAYDSWTQEQRIAREISILEGLLTKFYVTGTTLEVYRQGWSPMQDCPQFQCDEPVVHLAGGFSPRMFAISFVNKKIVDPKGKFVAQEKKSPAAASAARAAAAAPQPAASVEEPAAEAPAEAAAADTADMPPEAPSSSAQKYGFYLHVFDSPAAVIHQVRQVKKFFPGSPIYVMSDGGTNFGKLCAQEGCIFKLCPPANDRWHPWPFLHRLHEGAEALGTEYVIMLEPDNTIHSHVKRPPKADAGGLPVKDRKFGYRDFVEKQAQERKPGFKWTDRAMSAGLAGGAYFKTSAILDAFSDESVSKFDWNWIAEHATKEVYSSDFAMQYLLAARGYEIEPWDECAQMDKDKVKVHSGAQDAAFRHYCSCYPGGKPTYNLRVEAKDRDLFGPQLAKHSARNSVCQICYNFTKYKKDWGSTECTNKYDTQYSQLILDRYFPDGKYPQMR